MADNEETENVDAPEEGPAAESSAGEPAGATDAAEEPAAPEEPTAADEPAAVEPVAEEEPTAEEPAEEEPEAARPPAPKPRAARKQKAPAAAKSAAKPKKKPARAKPADRKPIVRIPKPEHARGRRKERRGVVVSSAMDKTIVVRVDTAKPHPRYKKVVRRSQKLHAHDEGNVAKPGDFVRVVETRPVSALKRWRLVEVVEAAK
jgi:small subunit ribosomal protein S17